MIRARAREHLKKHWHHHLSIGGIIAAVILLAAGAAAGTTALHFIARGGFHHSKPPPVIHVYGGAPLPPSWSLSADVVRVHNQGYSNSCVGQTLTTIEEIAQKRHHRPWAFSSGFIYDQVNGGRDQGSSYQSAAFVLTHQGDATLKAFPHDGQDWYAQPGPYALASARHYTFRAFRSINPSDRHTIEAELHAGRALALALPIRDSFYYHTGKSPITSDSGAYHFDHSITAIGYSRQGLRILNSWGPGWGANGQAILSWPLVASQTTEMVLFTPPKFPHKHPKTTPKRAHIHSKRHR